MKAITLDEFGATPVLSSEMPAPSPAVSDVLVLAGAWAELIVVPASSIMRKPERIDLPTAGAAAMAAITAMTAVDALELSRGDSLLIVAAAGAVGSFAVQLAVAAGATVIAPALPEDEAYLRSLGASELLPRDGDLVAAVRKRYPGRRRCPARQCLPPTRHVRRGVERRRARGIA
jgi:NADPH-dependent curcumin reductase CurA